MIRQPSVSGETPASSRAFFSCARSCGAARLSSRRRRSCATAGRADLPLHGRDHRGSVLPADRIPVRARRARDGARAFLGARSLPTISSTQLYIPARKGSVQIEMLAAPRRYGMVSYALEPQLDDVLREVAAGNPVVVLQNYGDWPI